MEFSTIKFTVYDVSCNDTSLFFNGEAKIKNDNIISEINGNFTDINNNIIKKIKQKFIKDSSHFILKKSFRISDDASVNEMYKNILNDIQSRLNK